MDANEYQFQAPTHLDGVGPHHQNEVYDDGEDEQPHHKDDEVEGGHRSHNQHDDGEDGEHNLGVHPDPDEARLLL